MLLCGSHSVDHGRRCAIISIEVDIIDSIDCLTFCFGLFCDWFIKFLCYTFEIFKKENFSYILKYIVFFVLFLFCLFLFVCLFVFSVFVCLFVCFVCLFFFFVSAVFFKLIYGIYPCILYLISIISQPVKFLLCFLVSYCNISHSYKIESIHFTHA